VRLLVDRVRATIAPSRSRRAAFGIGAGVLAIGVIAAAIVARDRAPVAARTAAAPPGPPPAPTPLTHLGGCAYSPILVDDDTVVFDLTRDGNVDLYRLDHGGAPERLTTDASWEWRAGPGPSDHEVAFIVSGGGVDAHLEVMDLATGARRVLNDDGAAPVHVGGAYYYTSKDLIRRLREPRDEVLLTLGDGEAADTLAASPRGDRIAWIVLAEQTLPRLCTSELAHPAAVCSADAQPSTGRVAFSHDGGSIYYDDDREHIMRWTIASGALTEVHQGHEALGGITVSPSGKTMVFSDCSSRTDLLSVLEDPTTPLVDDPRSRFPVAGPGGWLGFVHNDGRTSTLMVRGPDGRLTTLAGGDREGRFNDLAFDATADQLAYVFQGEEGAGVFVVRTIGSTQPNQITDRTGDAHPAFAGGDLVFNRLGADGAPHVMRVPIGGGDPVLAIQRPRVVVGSDTAHDRVLLASPGLDYLYWWDPRTGRETPGPRTVPGREPQDLEVSPDGAWLLEITSSGGQEVYVGPTDGELALAYTLAGDVSTRSGAIDVRGHPILAIDRWGGALWRAPAPDGAPW
jgi:hypothetical protein